MNKRTKIDGDYLDDPVPDNTTTHDKVTMWLYFVIIVVLLGYVWIGQI